MAIPNNDIYYNFLRCSLHNANEVPSGVESIDWEEFYVYCSKHGVLGIVLDNLDKLGLKLPQDIMLQWIMVVEGLKNQNRITNSRIKQLINYWDSTNHRCVVLKGQANATMYPKPELRCPGDIDLWVEGDEVEIIRQVISICPDAPYSIHHVRMPVFKDVPVEVHYRPVYLSNWFNDKKLKNYIDRNREKQFANKCVIDGMEVGCLTGSMNLVVQLLHMYSHFFGTRNNFKQLFDYYYLLRCTSNDDKKDLPELFKELGVLRYARGIMWIMKDVLGLEEDYLYVEPDEKVGRVILSETNRFGEYSQNTFVMILQQFIYNLKLIRLFPSEVLISPLFLVWHQWWKYKTTRALRRT